MGEIENAIIVKSPNKNEVITNSDRKVNITWEEVDEIENYQVELTIDLGASEWGETETYLVEENSLSVEGDGDNRYRFRIRAVYNFDDDEFGPWSSYNYFSFDTSGS